MTTSIRDAALAYAADGWRVFPVHSARDGDCTCGDDFCSSPAKHPLTANGFKDATTDAETIRQWWEHWPWANVAAAMGGDKMAIDGDRIDALKSLRPLPRTVAARTGREGGGVHLFFSTNGHRVTNSPGALPKGVQVRGEGGYVVLPPSLHASGRRYAWLDGQSPSDVGLADVPEQIIEAIEKRGELQVSAAAPHFYEGDRNTTLASLGGTMRRRGMTEEEIAVSLLAINERCAPPLPASEVRLIAHSVARYQPTEAGTAHGDLVAAFKTAEEVMSKMPEQVEWIVRPWATVGAITELGGKIKAAGKTTFALAMSAAVITGEAFAGGTVERGPVVYLTEQSAHSFREALARAELLTSADLHILTRGEAHGFSWSQVARSAGDKAYEVGAKMVIFDTLSEFAGLRGDEEQSAGHAGAAMAPVIELRDRSLAIVVVRHERKGGGEVGEAARGSSAFGGAVDIIISLRRPERRLAKTNRVIHALSRFEGTPETMMLDLVDNKYIAMGEEGAYAAELTKTRIEVALHEGSMTMNDLKEELELSRPTLHHHLKEMVSEGTITAKQEGKGLIYSGTEL